MLLGPHWRERERVNAGIRTLHSDVIRTRWMLGTGIFGSPSPTRILLLRRAATKRSTAISIRSQPNRETSLFQAQPDCGGDGGRRVGCNPGSAAQRTAAATSAAEADRTGSVIYHGPCWLLTR